MAYLVPGTRWLASRIDVRAAVSADAAEMARNGVGGEYELVFNGVELDHFDDATPKRSEAPTIAYIGRHEPRKGLTVLLDAMSRLPEGVRLWVMSRGPQTEELQRRYQRDTRIEWLGRVSEAEKVARIKGADVLCVPSLHGESFGVVLLEAMAARTPVVASDLPGYRNVARIGDEADLVPPGRCRRAGRRAGARAAAPRSRSRTRRGRTAACRAVLHGPPGRDLHRHVRAGDRYALSLSSFSAIPTSSSVWPAESFSAEAECVARGLRRLNAAVDPLFAIYRSRADKLLVELWAVHVAAGAIAGLLCALFTSLGWWAMPVALVAACGLAMFWLGVGERRLRSVMVPAGSTLCSPADEPRLANIVDESACSSVWNGRRSSSTQRRRRTRRHSAGGRTERRSW